VTRRIAQRFAQFVQFDARNLVWITDFGMILSADVPRLALAGSGHESGVYYDITGGRSPGV